MGVGFLKEEKGEGLVEIADGGSCEKEMTGRRGLEDIGSVMVMKFVERKVSIVVWGRALRSGCS